MEWKLITPVLSITLALGTASCDSNMATQVSNLTTALAANGSKDNAIILKVAMWDSDSDFLNSWTMKVKEFSNVMPNVKIELEAFKSDDDYLQAMRVRFAAGELPDIIELKPNFIHDFKTELLPLESLSVTAKNKKAKQFAVDGEILALPLISFPELVYYHPSVFKELDISVPTTWEQFVGVLTQIKKSGKYQPYAMGGKDSWTNYPFNEFMPLLSSGDENYYDNMAGTDKPFEKGSPFYKAYTDIQTLYDAKVMGADPLGLSNDQATGLFEAKKAAVIAAGLWYLPQYKSRVGNMDDLAAFPLPVRHSETEPLKVMTFTDNFFGINNKSKNIEIAKKFQEWMFSSDAYSFYVNKKQANSVMEDIEVAVPFLNDFYKANKVEEFNYRPGGEEFHKYINSIQLDWKKLGQEMMGGTPLDQIANDLNFKWMKARAWDASSGPL